MEDAPVEATAVEAAPVEATAVEAPTEVAAAYVHLHKAR